MINDRVMELVDMLNGHEYPFDRSVTKAEIDFAKAHGLVILYGDSDDRMELEGAVREEYGAWQGCKHLIMPDGKPFDPECECDKETAMRRCPLMIKAVEESKKIGKKLVLSWCAAPDLPPWTITFDAPHATFDIMEDGKCQSRGIVYAISDLK